MKKQGNFLQQTSVNSELVRKVQPTQMDPKIIDAYNNSYPSSMSTVKQNAKQLIYGSVATNPSNAFNRASIGQIQQATNNQFSSMTN